MAGEPWTTHEVEILAREYFAVLEAELAGQTVNKNDALRRAQSQIQTDRTIHTLKDRCYRISEELWKRDLPWVEGWKPPPLVNQSPNSANVSNTIWSAIEPLADHLSATTAVLDRKDEVAPGVDDAKQTQGRMTEAELRRAVEDVAQLRLMLHFEKLGWTVEDTHLTAPYDAIATKGPDLQYLEAKGTTTSGEAVLVTRGEVEWARAHVGQCVMGIVSGVRTLADGTVDPTSGTLRLMDWNPEAGTLTPVQLEWAPPT